MAIFPVGPTIGQEETVLGRIFVWDGYGWVTKVVSADLAAATEHIDGVDEAKHGSNQIINEAAVPNLGLDAGATAEEIFAAIPAPTTSIEKNPFTETIEIASLLQHSPNYTATSGATINIVKGAASTFINGVYSVKLALNNNSFIFPSGFDIQDGSVYNNLTGSYLFLFALLADGQISVTYMKIVVPTIDSPLISSYSGSGLNTYVDINLSEGVYGANDGTTPVGLGDFITTNFIGTGATAISISSVTNTSGAALAGGETSIRCNLSITGTPNGKESFEIMPANATSVYSASGIAMSATERSGIINIVNNSTAVSISNYGLYKDNSYVDIFFSRGVWGDIAETSPVGIGDIQITNTAYSGITNFAISSIEKIGGGTLVGGETGIRVRLSITGISDGSERLQIQPIDSTSIYDSSSNALVSTETTGDIYLIKQTIALPLTFQPSNTINVTEPSIGIYAGTSSVAFNCGGLADETLGASSSGYLVQDILNTSDTGDIALLGFSTNNLITSFSQINFGIYRQLQSYGGKIAAYAGGVKQTNIVPFENSKIRVRRTGINFIAEYTKGYDEWYIAYRFLDTSSSLMYSKMFILNNTTTCSNPKIQI